MNFRIIQRIAATIAVIAIGPLASASSLTEYASGSAIGSFDSTGATKSTYEAQNGIVSDGLYPVDAIAEFPLASLQGTNITSATLKLYTVAISGNANDIAAYGYAGDGTASASDMGKGSLVQDAGSVTVPQTVSFDATSLIQNLVNAKDSYAGFDIRNIAPLTNFSGDWTMVQFHTYAGVNAPTLVVNYQPVPTPASASLLACLALPCLIIRGQRPSAAA